MDDISYKLLKSRFPVGLKIIPEGSTVENALDIIRSLLGDRDRQLLEDGVKKLRSAAVTEYLARMREINKARKEEARRLLEELTDSPQSKLPGKLAHYQDRDPDLPTHLLTAADYRK